jgi:RNA binding exosome subunit
MSLTLHDDIISVYISVSVYQQMSLTLHDDIISVYISVSTNFPKTTSRYN